jgi:hypothetical protein
MTVLFTICHLQVPNSVAFVYLEVIRLDQLLTNFSFKAWPIQVTVLIFLLCTALDIPIFSQGKKREFLGKQVEMFIVGSL